MLKGRDILGKPVVSYQTGERIDTVKDLVFDQNNNQLLGLLLEEAGWLRSAKAVLLKNVQAIGPDAVIVPSKDSIVNVNDIAILDNILKHNNILKGTHIMTTDGRDLGTMIDLYFDEQTGSVEGYEVSGGLFADAYSGRSFVPAIQTLKIGEDVAFVPSQTADYMEEQVGGIKGAVQSASAKVQDAAQVTGDKLQELGQATSQQVQAAAEVTGEKLQAFKVVATENAQAAAELTGEKFQEFKATATQKAQVAGERLEEFKNVAGEQIGDRLNSATTAFDSTIATLGIEEALGRRSQQLVRSDSGIIIVAPGQIVTGTVIERAKTYHKEQAILSAVGLSKGEAVRDRTQQIASVTGSKLQATTQATGEQIQSSAKSLWGQVKETANDLQGRSTEMLEEHRIRGALGRPITRVILDKDDTVILNVGELITHQAIHLARQSNVLDLLLNSVYTETPKLSLQDLRAPQVGQAAL
jgi:uncharacterized protein YrrD